MSNLSPRNHRQIDGPIRRTPGPVPPEPAAKPSSPVFEYAKPDQGRKRRRILKRSGLAVLGLIVVVGAFFGIKTLVATHKVITRNSLGGAPALAGQIDPTKLRGEGDGRINILLLGIGGAGHQGADLSDTIMVVSIDPRTKDVAMLGIPRDLWVPIPGSGSAKINAAHAYGEQKRYPGGGPALAKATVSKVLDIPIHYFGRVDFRGFTKAVDAVSGLDLVIDKAIYDNQYPNGRGGHQVFSLQAGPIHLNGATALKYTRSRYSTSDFDRALRQQKVLVAFRQKLVAAATITNPAKIASLIDIVGNNAKTDLQINEIKKLAGLVKDIDSSRIISKVLDTSAEGLLVSGNRGGGYVELPKSGNFSEIQEFVHSIFVDSYLKDEAARVEISNASGRSGLATAVTKTLKSYHYNIVGTVTAPAPVRATAIYDYTGQKPYTVGYLEKRFGVKAQRRTATAGGPDLQIVLGSDYRAN